jgi:hypothetical protein
MVWMTTLRSAPATTLVDSKRVQEAQVPAELQEPGAGLARLDVPVELVLAQVAGGEQVPDPAVRVARIRGRGTRPGPLTFELGPVAVPLARRRLAAASRSSQSGTTCSIGVPRLPARTASSTAWCLAS